MTSSIVDLNDDLWHKILKALNHEELLRSCMLVCRSWRSLSLELLGGNLTYPGPWLMSEDAPRWSTKFERHIKSIQAYILRQATRLKSVKMLFTFAHKYQVQRILVAMGNCKQLEHLAVSGIIGPVNLDPLPASLRRLDINLDMQCAYSRGGYTYDGYGLEKPTWTISYSSLPALTSLSSPTDSHEVMKQVGKLTSLARLTLFNCSLMDDFSQLTSLMNLTHLSLTPLYTLDPSLQELMMGLPRLKEAIFPDMRALLSDFDLAILQRHPNCPEIAIDVYDCSSAAFQSVMMSPIVAQFWPRELPNLEEVYRSLNWSGLNKVFLRLPCMGYLVVDWDQIFSAPRLKTLKLYAWKSVSFRNMESLSKAALERKGLQFQIALSGEYGGYGEVNEFSPEICLYFEAEGLYLGKKWGCWVAGSSGSVLDF